MDMESSAATYGAAKIDARPDLRGPAMITDKFSDVRVKYKINQKEIGHGHYGVVRKCMDRETKVAYAVKSIRKSKVGKIEVLKREVALLKECEHPNIINLVDVHEDQKYLHLITELCTGGELFDRIIEKTQSEEGHFSERDAAGLIKCILDAIAYCHNRHVVHRDLKPENFLFSSREEDAVIKIIDFGLSRHDDTNQAGIMNTKVGTPYYVAPEVLNREYTKSCDIWSIGVITYILVSLTCSMCFLIVICPTSDVRANALNSSAATPPSTATQTIRSSTRCAQRGSTSPPPIGTTSVKWRKTSSARCLRGNR